MGAGFAHQQDNLQADGPGRGPRAEVAQRQAATRLR
jgi:hypothetical protein